MSGAQLKRIDEYTIVITNVDDVTHVGVREHAVSESFIPTVGFKDTRQALKYIESIEKILNMLGCSDE